MGNGVSKNEKLWLEKANKSLRDELDVMRARMRSELDMRNVQVCGLRWVPRVPMVVSSTPSTFRSQR